MFKFNTIDVLEGLIDDIEKEMLTAKRYKLFSYSWTEDLPSHAGIYIIRNGEQIVYVGETANIKDRMSKDMKNTQNHTIRRNIGKMHFDNHPEYTKANQSKKYAASIETLIDQFMRLMTVSVIPVYVGRLEVEEYLVLKYEPIYNSKINKRSLK